MILFRTNITEVHGEHNSSRGHLVSSFLQPGGPDAAQYTGSLVTGAPADYAGFNLLLLSPLRGAGAEHGNGSIAYDGSLITNSGGGGVITARPLNSDEKRLGGISNGVDGVDAQDWPKVKQGCANLGAVLSGDATAGGVPPEKLAEELFEVLTCASLSLSLWCLSR